MTPAAAPLAANAPLGQWLRLLWDRTPPLRFDATAPCISAGEIHLPVRDQWRHHAAAAAHATAHLVYSPAAFDGSGLGPVVRALTALLEDARVEALAMRELPGLVRLWLPRHTATPDSGNGFEALMSRLARALIDPGYDDPDPWVAKGRRLFFIDAGLGLLALRTPSEVRHAATLLGHDIGQMRLPFNAKTYRPEPAYRDDHRWMWAADAVVEATPPPDVAALSHDPDDGQAPAPDESVTLQPEWDRLIARLRPDWCRVTASGPAPAAAAGDDEDTRRAAHALRRPLAESTPRSSMRREADGEFLDPDALADWQVARRLRQPADARVYRAAARAPAATAVWLLVDQSASTAAPGASGEPLLRGAARAAAAIGGTLGALNVPCAIAAFSSAGRHAVRLRIAKTIEQRFDAEVRGRLRALRPGGSTRLGSVLRHAAARLAVRGRGPHWILLLSDGEPHDVDVHDPRYLVEDARHAVAAAAARGVRVACLVMSPHASADLTRIFGRRGWHLVPALRTLPHALRALLASS